MPIHQNLVSQLVMHLIVKAGSFVQVTFTLAIYSIFLALFGLCNLPFFDIFDEVASFCLFHVDVEVHFGEVIRLLLAVVSRLVELICQSFLQTEAACA